MAGACSQIEARINRPKTENNTVGEGELRAWANLEMNDRHQLSEKFRNEEIMEGPEIQGKGEALKLSNMARQALQGYSVVFSQITEPSRSWTKTVILQRYGTDHKRKN